MCHTSKFCFLLLRVNNRHMRWKNHAQWVNYVLLTYYSIDGYAKTRIEFHTISDEYNFVSGELLWTNPPSQRTGAQCSRVKSVPWSGCYAVAQIGSRHISWLSSIMKIASHLIKQHSLGWYWGLSLYHLLHLTRWQVCQFSLSVNDGVISTIELRLC